MVDARRFRTLIAAAALVPLLAAGSVTGAYAAPDGPGGQGRDPVRILRDEYGVPHVYASSARSVFYGVGYAQGQDRLWQAEIHRRLATGTLSELFGPSVLPGDVFARQLFGPPARRAEMVAHASALVGTVLQSFTDGMNAWIAQAERDNALPAPYALVGPPRPWTVDDSVATYLYFAFAFGTFGGDELDNLAQLQDLTARLGAAGGQQVFADTHWLDDPSAPTTVPSGSAVTAAAPPAGAPRPPSTAASGVRAGLQASAASAREAMASAQRVFARFGVERAPASNAIVIGPRLSADGRPLLLGGPQMGYSTPQVNHEIGIHGGGFDVTGMELAGWPITPIGVTSDHAWTLTSGGTDNTDLYAETIRLLPGAGTPQYLFRGEWLPMDCRTEQFVTGPQPLCETVHGPVISPLPDAPTAQATAITMKLATRGLEMQSYDAWLSLGRARTLAEFEAAASVAAYNFNLLYADRKGNIAYWHIGRFPIRAPGDNPFLPHDGTGGAEWQGFMPFDQQPHALNPERGWMASWNNKPAANWSNSSTGFWGWGPVHRVNTLVNLLDRVEPGTASLDTLARINRTAGTTTDTPSGSADTVFVSTLLDDLLRHVDTAADPRLPAIVARLAGWDWLQVDADGNGSYDNPSVAIFNTWWPTLVEQVFGDELPGYDGDVLGNLVARLIGAAPGSLPLGYPYLGGQPVDAAVTTALVTALDQLTARFGPEPGGWLQPVAHIDWEPLPLVPAVPDTIWMNRGTYNQLVHLGPGSHLAAQNVVAPGQSGDPASPHFADQLALYASWQYKPMRLVRSDLAGHITASTWLHPPG
jgi:penicillin G amidase